MLILGLTLVIFVVLVGPFLSRKIENHLETFLFVMGLIAVTIAKVWSKHLIEEALLEPIKIALAVLIVSLTFRKMRKIIHNGVSKVEHKIGLPLFIFLLTVFLGLSSSIITAIMAALVLVEVVGGLHFDKNSETKLVIIGCFSIGLGAALTPIGEPLSTIAVAKLKGYPHHADFFYLVKLLGWPVVWGIIALGILAIFLLQRAKEVKNTSLEVLEVNKESLARPFIRAGKVYLFVMALIFLGGGFKPVIDQYIAKISPLLLFWINITSAILDNATLTAAEITPIMDAFQIKSALLALLTAGGMLIPGNIPNIICANKLGIGSRAWASLGIPLGFAMMIIYFVILHLL